VDTRRSGFIGHSEGSIISAIATTKRPDDVRFLVFLAGVGVPMEQLLARQGQDILRALGLGGEALQRAAENQRTIFATVLRAKSDAELSEALKELTEQQLATLTPEQREAMGNAEAQVEAQLGMVKTRWFRQLLQHDPRPVLRQIQCPLLALNGEKDLQVAADENLPGIRAALEEAGNRNVETVAFPGLNHLFQTATTGAPSEYGQIAETFAPAALEKVSQWILARPR
jgi:pimeloyl-ACP methyl ester carboxylesterase